MNVGRKSLFYIGEKIIVILISTYLQFGRNCGQKPTYVLDPEDKMWKYANWDSGKLDT